MTSAPKLIFFITEDWYFCSHRLPLAIAAQRAGYEVIVATRVSQHGDEITQAGLRLIPLKNLKRSSTNLFSEWAAIREIVDIYRREKPALTHHVALKPVVYGSLSAWIAGVPRTVNAMAGLGFVFSSDKPFARILRPWISILFRLLLNNAQNKIIIQNLDDLQLLNDRIGIDHNRLRLIRGAGVDMDRYVARPPVDGPPIIMLASRMLWDKGVGEFVNAALALKIKKVEARFVLVGNPDRENPAAISKQQLTQWHHDGIVEWWGYRSDMPEVLAQANIVCLPSYYGEGIPKVLIEAMACGRPIVTTDMPGCRELVQGGENGILVPPRDSQQLAMALEKLVNDASLRARMGAASRKIAEREYALPRIVAETLDVYRELLT